MLSWNPFLFSWELEGKKIHRIKLFQSFSIFPDTCEEDNLSWITFANLTFLETYGEENSIRIEYVFLFYFSQTMREEKSNKIEFFSFYCCCYFWGRIFKLNWFFLIVSFFLGQHFFLWLSPFTLSHRRGGGCFTDKTCIQPCKLPYNPQMTLTYRELRMKDIVPTDLFEELMAFHFLWKHQGLYSRL